MGNYHWVEAAVAVKRSSRILKTASQPHKAVALLPMKALENERAKERFDIIRDEEDIRLDDPENAVPDPDWSDTGSIRELCSPLAEIERSAYKRGFSSGEKAAYALIAEENEAQRKNLILKNEQVSQSLSTIMEEMGGLKTKLLMEAREDILAIALAVVQRILGQGAEASCETILAHIEKAINKVGNSEKIVVRLPPLDLDRISEESESLSVLFEANAALKFEADAELASGECIVEGPECMVDGRFESQMSLFAEALREKV